MIIMCKNRGVEVKMNRKYIKRGIVFLLACSMVFTQSLSTVCATDKESENISILEVIPSNYHEFEPIDSSFANVTSKWEHVRSGNLPSSYSASTDFPEEVKQRDDHVTSVKEQTHGTCQTIKKLPKGKKYKIQIRSYKKVKGLGTYYSAWSASKEV